MAYEYKTHIALYLGEKCVNPKATKFDQLVCFATNEPYSHIELVYDYSPVTNIGLTWSSSPRDGGVRPTRIDFNSGHWEVYQIPTQYSEDQIIEWFNNRSGIKYDWFGAFGVVLPFFGNDPKKLFCSEAIGYCLDIPKAYKMSPGGILKHYGDRAKRVA